MERLRFHLVPCENTTHARLSSLPRIAIEDVYRPRAIEREREKSRDVSSSLRGKGPVVDTVPLFGTLTRMLSDIKAYEDSKKQISK